MEVWSYYTRFLLKSHGTMTYHISWGWISRHNGQSCQVTRVQNSRAPLVTQTGAPGAQKADWALAVPRLSLGVSRICFYLSDTSSAWRAARGIQRSRRRGRDENQCDFKPIQVSLSLNNCNLQLLYLPPPLPRTSEMPYCGGTQLPSQLYFTKNNPSIIPLGRPKSYKDSSETFCQYHLLDDELRKFLMCCKKCFLSPETMR